MYRQQILSRVRSIILDTTSHLRPEQLLEAASLTGDLNMDYPHLEALMSRLTKEVDADIAFTPWYIRASRGHDTLGSLVDFLVDYSWRSDTSIAAAIEAHTEPLPEAAIHPRGQTTVAA